MKKQLITLLALAAAIACSKENTTNTLPEGPQTRFKEMSIKTGDTKTSLDGHTCAWSQGDSFLVFADQTSYTEGTSFRMVADNTFKGPVPEETTDFYAVYGNVSSASWDNGFSASVTIPTIQAATADSFDPQAHIAAAHGTCTPGSEEAGYVTFSTFVRLVKVSVPEGISSVKLSSESKFAGNVTLCCAADGSLSMDGEATENYVTLSNGGSEIPAGSYYMCVAPVDVQGIQLTYTFTDGSTYTKTSKATLDMAAKNNIRNLSITIPAPSAEDFQIGGFYTSYNYATGTDGAELDLSIANSMSNTGFRDCEVVYSNGWGSSDNSNASCSFNGGEFIALNNLPELSWGEYEIGIKVSLGGQEFMPGESFTRQITGLPYRPADFNDWSVTSGSEKVKKSGNQMVLGNGGTTMSDPTVASPGFHIPGESLSATTSILGSVTTRNVTFIFNGNYPCTLTLHHGIANVNVTSPSTAPRNSTSSQDLTWDNLPATYTPEKNNISMSVNGRTELSGYATITGVSVLYR